MNSILWIRKGKDTLAIANITGAMVFQGLLLPVMGIALTDWQLPWEKQLAVSEHFLPSHGYLSMLVNIPLKSQTLYGEWWIVCSESHG